MVPTIPIAKQVDGVLEHHIQRAQCSAFAMYAELYMVFALHF